VSNQLTSASEVDTLRNYLAQLGYNIPATDYRFLAGDAAGSTHDVGQDPAAQQDFHPDAMQQTLDELAGSSAGTHGIPTASSQMNYQVQENRHGARDPVEADRQKRQRLMDDAGNSRFTQADARKTQEEAQRLMPPPPLPVSRSPQQRLQQVQSRHGAGPTPSMARGDVLHAEPWYQAATSATPRNAQRMQALNSGGAAHNLSHAAVRDPRLLSREHDDASNRSPVRQIWHEQDNLGGQHSSDPLYTTNGYASIRGSPTRPNYQTRSRVLPSPHSYQTDGGNETLLNSAYKQPARGGHNPPYVNPQTPSPRKRAMNPENVRSSVASPYFRDSVRPGQQTPSQGVTNRGRLSLDASAMPFAASQGDTDHPSEQRGINGLSFINEPYPKPNSRPQGTQQTPQRAFRPSTQSFQQAPRNEQGLFDRHGYQAPSHARLCLDTSTSDHFWQQRPQHQQQQQQQQRRVLPLPSVQPSIDPSVYTPASKSRHVDRTLAPFRGAKGMTAHSPSRLNNTPYFATRAQTRGQWSSAGMRRAM